MFDEINEILDQAQNNSLKLCRIGGMRSILILIITHKNDIVRKAACRAFNTVTSNNQKVQLFAGKLGAINLLAQLERERTPFMREAVLGSLCAFLKTENFAGKRLYVARGQGLRQIRDWLLVKGKEEKEKYGDANMCGKIRIKLLQLLYDLVLNDDGIINDGCYVRDFVGNDQ